MRISSHSHFALFAAAAVADLFNTVWVRKASWPALRRLFVVLLVLLGHQPPAGAVSTTAESLTDRVRPAVVTVATKLDGQTDDAQSLGSGFFAGRPGLVVTNYHVVALMVRKPKGRRLEVELVDGRRLPAKVITFDIVQDIALLWLDAPDTEFFQPGLRLTRQMPAKGAALSAFGNASAMGVVESRGHYSGQIREAGI